MKETHGRGPFLFLHASKTYRPPSLPNFYLHLTTNHFARSGACLWTQKRPSGACVWTRTHACVWTRKRPLDWVLIGLATALIAITGCHQSNVIKDKRPLVHQVSFVGIKHVKEGDLRAKILVENQSWNPLNRSNYLDHPFAMDLDKERIEAFYRDHGYFQAKVISAETRPYKGDKAIDVVFTVEEGEPTRISQVNLIGLQTLTDRERQTLSSMLEVKEGQILARANYLSQKDTWLRFLKDKGYAFAEVELQVRVNRDLLLGEIDFQVKAGDYMLFGNTKVNGCQKTDPNAVSMHAAIPKGARYLPEDIEFATKKLYNLGLFSSVKIKVVPDPNQKNVADVEIEVVEGKRQEAQVGIGFGLESQLTEVHAKGGYTEHNFLGGLRTLRVTGHVGFAAAPAFWTDQARMGPIAGIEAQLLQPDWLGRNSALKINLGYNIGLENAYQYHGPGFNIGVDRYLWRRQIQLSLSYHFQFLQFFNTATAILQTSPQEAGQLFGYEDPYRLGYFRQSIVLDLRNREVEASQGLYVGLIAEEGGVYSGSAFTYQKILPEIRGYLSLGSRLTVAARMMFGQIFAQGDLGSPITQRFFLGGPNSHRGFSYNRLSAQVAGSDVRIPLGGDQMLLLQVEARVNAVRIFGNWFSLVGFMDGGDVAKSSCTICDGIDYGDGRIDLGNLHWAAGLGLRYKTLIGTLRFDVGARINRVDENILNAPDPGARFAYHLSIGEAF